jgi:hypothetical protein
MNLSFDIEEARRSFKAIEVKSRLLDDRLNGGDL